MSILTDKHFRLALLISVLAHGTLLCPLPAFRFNHPLSKRLREMEIIYYRIKENPPPEQKTIQVTPQVARALIEAAKGSMKATEGGDSLIAKEGPGQRAEELNVRPKVEVKELELEELKEPEKKDLAKVAEEKIATFKDIPREQKPLFLDYYRAIRERIKRSAIYPSGARRNLIEGITHLSFVLSNEGGLREVAVKRSSGNRLLDRSAVQSIEGASPFPPFPKGLWQPQLRLSIKISYELD